MDEAIGKSGEWPNVALVPGTHTHAATGEHVEQPEWTRVNPSPAKLFEELLFNGKPTLVEQAVEAIRKTERMER